MGSRYRCRVSPSGVPGCIPGLGTGATGATAEGEISNGFAIKVVSPDAPPIPIGVETELLSQDLIIEEGQSVILMSSGGYGTVDGSGTIQVRIYRDAVELSNFVNSVNTETEVVATLAYDADPPAGLHTYRLTAEAIGIDFIVNAQAFLHALVVTSPPFIFDPPTP